MARRALISVSDKVEIATFAKGLSEIGFEILSTGGTARALEEAKIPVTKVEESTGVPEMFRGRVKTLHPKILGGILMRRDSKEDCREAEERGIEPIDLVVVNLYPFTWRAQSRVTLSSPVLSTVEGSKGSSQEELIEHIDIGGVTLLRAAAKNFAYVSVVCDPADYARVFEELQSSGTTSHELRAALASKAFACTAAYDAAITEALSQGKNGGLALINGMELRYGENPHQWGRYYDILGCDRRFRVLQEEKHMSYLNVLDADSAMNLVCEFEGPTAACIKHANPSGVASHTDIAEAFQRSYDADRLSAFGVIVALNKECPKAVVEKIIEQKIFVEVLIAPSFASSALLLLKAKPKIRVIECACPHPENHTMYRSSLGGMLVQHEDTRVIAKGDLECVTNFKPSDEQIEDLLFAWKVVKHAKSNAIVFAKDKTTVGIGCGQTSRVDSTMIAARRAGERAKGAVMASDAFFPFPDSVEEAAKHGISAIIQPGGSKRDHEITRKANELKIPMVITGIRAFKH